MSDSTQDMMRPISAARGTAAEDRSPVFGRLSVSALAVICTLLATRAAGPITDPDTWWHLRLGEEFRGEWSLGDPGQLSPFAERPWFATQWLLEVMASYLNDAFGLAGVAWLTGAGVLALGAALLHACRREGDAVVAAVVTVLALVAAIPTLAPRPQLASFILLAIFTAAWLQSARDLRPRWWLVPLSWVWACTHGMWFTGTIIGFAVVLGLLLDRRLRPREAARLSLVPLLSIVAAALTPVGPKLLLAPLATSGAAEFIAEWKPPNFAEPAAAIVGGMLILVVLAWGRGSRTSWSHLLVLVVAAGWTVLSLRTLTLGAVIAAPLLASALQEWITGAAPGPVSRRERKVTAVTMVVAVAALTLAIPNLPVQDGRPVGPDIDSALSRLPAGTVVFNEYDLGGWLVWRHRNVTPVVDGMSDAYQPAYLADYVAARDLEDRWYDFVLGTGADYALLPSDLPLAIELQDHRGWGPVAEGAGHVLLSDEGSPLPPAETE